MFMNITNVRSAVTSCDAITKNQKKLRLCTAMPLHCGHFETTTTKRVHRLTAGGGGGVCPGVQVVGVSQSEDVIRST